MATVITVDQINGREVEQPGLVSQMLAFAVDFFIVGGLAAAIEAPLGELGYWVAGPVLFVMPYCWRRWHRSPGMALCGLYVYRTDDPDRPIGIWRGFVRFDLLIVALMAMLLFLMATLLAVFDLATLRGVNPVDSLLGLRVVRYKAPPAGVDLVGHAFDTAGVFADVRLTDMEPDAQPHDAHGNPD